MSSVSKENVKHHCGTAYIVATIVAFVLVIVGVVLYKYVPVSDIANSIERPGKDGLVFLAFSPVSAFLAFAVFLIGGIADKVLVKNSVVQLVIFIVSAVLLAFVAASSAAMFFTQLPLGFVAPLGDTFWATLGTANIFAAVLFTAANIYIIATARK